ncbi:hypothetical protein BCR36DRAFT_416901 [Piromyces finnis]|uniref:Right handed beta helix domain-containing protein n=1 Tax=Piromyces finnis TaxID=1754191 RepID=A0A1Y1UQP6_9FUNG|nr:hypothetical protein BCR36DRAFT_416901 [Piromyces finnis]|eukprot:ORX40408.1 hypothetical protein BCR36DRAFT_416901 [Piromyces finnis]
MDYDKKIVFRNITFYNYNNNNNQYSNLFVFDFMDKENRSTIEFDNCTFNKVKGIIHNFHISCEKKGQKTPQVIFRNTKFINSGIVFLAYHTTQQYNKYNSLDCFHIVFENCIFDDINAIGQLVHGDVTFNNCTFNNLKKGSEYSDSLFESDAENNKVIIKNSKITNIILDNNIPFFELYKSYLM